MGRRALPALLLVAATLEAQESFRPPVSDSLLLPTTGASAFFDRNQNTYTWLGRIAVETEAWGNSIRFINRYSTNIFALEGGPSARRLESRTNAAALLLSRSLTRHLRLQADWSSLSFSDEKDVGLSSTASHTVQGGVEYSPVVPLRLFPLAGYRWDRQTGITDRGLHLALVGRLEELDLDGVLLHADGRYQEDRLNPRVLEGHHLRAGIRKTFIGRTRDSLQVGVVRNRREYYTLTDGVRGVESRTETVIGFGNLLDVELSRSLLTSLYVGLTNRAVGKDLRFPEVSAPPAVFGSDINEFRLESYLQVAWEGTPGGPSGLVQMSYLERNEEHAAVSGVSTPAGPALEARDDQEKRKNNLTRRTALAGVLLLPFGSADTVRIAGSTSVLRYDTPSRENVEDRDELLSALAVSAARRFSRTFHAAVGLEGTASHTVYLLADRSANNSRNYVLRFWPATWFRPAGGLVTVNTFEVLANYTVYDFEEQSALVRSFSYRQFAWTDSTALELSRRIGLDFLAQLKLYERGQLRWGEFTERTENSFDERSLALQARFRPVPGVTLAAGYRSFRQRRYVHGAEERRLEVEIGTTGPTCTILWEPAGRGSLALTGWYERRTQTGGEPRMLPTMSMNVHLNF